MLVGSEARSVLPCLAGELNSVMRKFLTVRKPLCSKAFIKNLGRSDLAWRAGVKSNFRRKSDVGTVTRETQAGSYEISHVWGRGPDS